MTTIALSEPAVVLDSLKGELSLHEVIFSFGVSDGALYRKLRGWLHEGHNHYLVFIEDEEERYLKMKDSALGKDPKVRLYFYQEENEEFFKEIAWEFLFLKFSFAAASPYASLKAEKMQHLFSQLAAFHQGIDLFASDYQDLGVRVLKNVIANQNKLPSSYLGQSLKGACKNIPAIICGAGPSLDAALPDLKELQDRALVFAGGSAVTALSDSLVIPHFCAHLDPEPPTDRFLKQQTFEVPHFYQSRFSSHLLDRVHGPLFWMAEGGSYPIETWIKEQYGISYPSFASGWTVVNLCAAIAAHLGCNPIIFVGVDLSCPGTQVYAGKEKGEEHEGSWISVKDILGNEVLSKRDWVMSAQWQSDLIASMGEIRWIHAQEGGLEIPGMERASLREVGIQYCQEKRDLHGDVHALICTARPSGISLEQIAEVTERLKASFQKCDQLVDQMLSLWEKQFPRSPVDTGEYALAQHDLLMEPAFAQFIDPLWHVWKRPIVRNSQHPFDEMVHQLLFVKRVVEANMGAFS